MFLINPNRYSSQIDPVVQYNTFIGGIGASYPDAASLASKLNISTSDISDYTVDAKNDIACNINVSYQIPLSAFASTGLTYWQDVGAKISTLKANCFKECQQMRYFYSSANLTAENYVFRRLSSSDVGQIMIIDIPNANSIDGQSLYLANASEINIKSALTLGSTVGDDFVFNTIKGNPKIHVDPSLLTVNSGGLEGDLAYAQGQGATIVSVQNSTAPDAITDFSIGTKYATALQVLFTPPTSTNTILFYQAFNGNKMLGIIEASGDYITELIPDTTYSDLKIVAVDEFFNKSEVSNTVSDTTEVSAKYDTNKIASYYKIESNANDSSGTKNGTATSVTYSNGYAIFNGSAYITLPADIISNIQEFSFTFLVQADDNAAEYRCFVLNNNTGMPCAMVGLNRGGTANKIQVDIYNGSSQKIINTISYDVKNLIHIGVRASLVTESLSLFINGNIIGTTSITSFGQIETSGQKNNVLGAARNFTSKLKGKERGVAIWNAALSDAEFGDIAYKQLNGDQLI